MSTVNTNKVGHPVAGIVLGICGIAVALLTTLLFGVIAGAVAGVLGIIALLLGVSARRRSSRGMGAIVSGVLALVLAVTLSFSTVGMMNYVRDTAAASGVAPNLAKHLGNPYFGMTGVVTSIMDEHNDTDAIAIIHSELDALNNYASNEALPAAEAAPIAG